MKRGDEPSRESALTALLAERAEQLGFECYPINQTRGKPRQWVKPGPADLFMVGHGVNLWVETKVGRNSQQPDQREFERLVKQNGGMYWVCRTVDEFVTCGKAKGWWR
jgi:hypothetical protein